MKKIFKFLFSLVLILNVYKIYASEIQLTYSEWSLMYPSGLDASFIESEDRYHFYKVVDNQIEYIDEYYTELDGYIKDEESKRTFYRYITNPMLVFNSENEMLLDYQEYCKKNFCFIKSFVEPNMTDLSEKIEGPNYSTTDMFEISSTVPPMTGDNITFSFILLAISLAILLLIVIKKKKMSYE